MPESIPRPQTYRHPRRLLAAGFGAGILANAWFLDAPLGAGFSVFILLWVLTLALLGGKESWQRAGSARWLLLPMVACAGFVGVRDAQTLVALNVTAVVALGCLAVQLFSGERPLASLGLRGYLGATLAGGGRGLIAGPVLVSDAVNLEGIGSTVNTWARPVFRAAVFAVPIVVLFGALLASADEVFSRLISARLNSLSDGDWAGAVSTAGIVGGVGLSCAGMWAVALRRRDKVSPFPVLNAERRVHRGGFEAFAVVGSLLVLFSGFGAIQAACLFGQVALPVELTWAAYARQGFFQLLVVTGLTLALITILGRVVLLPEKHKGPFAACCTALVGLTLLILASAVKRLTLYEEAYGFTELRVYSHVFSFALGAMLLWRAVTLWRFTASFATGAGVALIGFVLALDVLNPDAFIATKNIERQAQVGRIDLWHLSTLSADATPVLAQWANAPDIDHAHAWSNHVAIKAQRTGFGLPSMNLSRRLAAELIAEASAPRL